MVVSRHYSQVLSPLSLDSEMGMCFVRAMPTSKNGDQAQMNHCHLNDTCQASKYITYALRYATTDYCVQDASDFITTNVTKKVKNMMPT